MKLDEFEAACNRANMDFEDPILQCLYLIKKNHWNEAHEIAQDNHTKFGSLLHGFLHRIEGDNWNASYWYRRAGEKDFDGSFDDEWKRIAAQYLGV